MKTILKTLIENGYDPNVSKYYVGLVADKGKAYDLITAINKCRPGHCVRYKSAGNSKIITERDLDGTWYI